VQSLVLPKNKIKEIKKKKKERFGLI
jgi:hypothetical protein